MRTLTILAAVALLLSACAGASAPATTKITATLTDNKITLSSNSAPAGTVTFSVKNSGAMEHELVVLRTDVAEDKIAPDADEPGKVEEEGNLGESGDLAAGDTKEFTLQLPAGTYVLICNEIGHYQLGMHVAFVVR